ncbi:MAG: PilZ domain-containing protein [Novosphingobium sp.]|uniref:PilZ domain-containing protein n=1 Tax=Novosphingobium sp. TaxID=1874826 RepID=UPI0032BEF1BB
MARRKAAKAPEIAPPHDQREAQRFTLILRAGKLVTAQGEFLCILRDVSSGGLKVRLFHALDLSAPCQIELAGGERYDLAPAWQDGAHAGLRFAGGPVDIPKLLEEAGPFPKRSIRIHLPRPLPAVLHAGGLAFDAALHDISQHGAALACTECLPVGQLAEICADQLGTIKARVRWRRGTRFGLVFQQSFRLDELARLTARLQGLAAISPEPAEVAAC